MPSCVVKWCKNNSGSQHKSCGITFHKFPGQSAEKGQWIEVIRKSRQDESWLPSKFSVVCSVHFHDCDLYMTQCGIRRVVKDAIPRKISIDQTNENGDSENLDTSVPSTSTVLNDPLRPLFEQANVLEKSRAGTSHPCDLLEAETLDISASFENASTTPITSGADSDIESLYDTPVERRLRLKLRRQQNFVNTCKSKMKILNQKVRRLKKRNQSLKNIIKDLEDNIYVDIYNKLPS